jgi:hypothetical protein
VWVAHGAVTRRPPISLDTMVPRTGGYAYDVGVWDLSIVQGPFSVAPCQTLESIRNFCIAVSHGSVDLAGSAGSASLAP